MLRILDDLLATNALLWVSLAVLMLGFALWARRRHLAERARARLAARRAQEEAEEGGESRFLPPPRIAPAVEVVDLEALLADESSPVAAAARRQLEEPTNIGGPDSLQVLSLATPPPVVDPRGARPAAAARPAVAAPAPVLPRDEAPRPVPAAQPPGARQPAAQQPAARKPAAAPRVPDAHVPVRELALAWFEARGYRPSPASEAVRPIELVLRHRNDAGRAYAFVVEPRPVSAERAIDLAQQARSIGLMRLLVAAEAGIDGDARQRVRKLGVRLIDHAAMRAEFDKLEINVAAKIIAVARSRAQTRAQA